MTARKAPAVPAEAPAEAPAEVAVVAAEAPAEVSVPEAVGERSLAALKAEWTDARTAEAEGKNALMVAAGNLLNAQVRMSRTAYLTATHSSVKTARSPMNITRAAEALDMAYGTLRPYVLAGQALAAEERVGLLSAPDETDRAIVNDALEGSGRGRRRELRQADADKPDNGGKSGKGSKSGKGKGKGKSPKPDAEAPKGDAGLSLEAEALELSRQLVACIKSLRAGKAWSGDTAADVSAILAEVFPILGKDA